MAIKVYSKYIENVMSLLGSRRRLCGFREAGAQSSVQLRGCTEMVLQLESFDPIDEGSVYMYAKTTERRALCGIYPTGCWVIATYDEQGKLAGQLDVPGGCVQMDTILMEYRKWEKGLLRSDGRPGFDTPTGKLEIASTILDEHGYDALPVYHTWKRSIRAKGICPAVPPSRPYQSFSISGPDGPGKPCCTDIVRAIMRRV